MTLTKADLVGQLVGQSGLDRPDAKQLVNQMFEEIRGSLENGEAVKLAGFRKSPCQAGAWRSFWERQAPAWPLDWMFFIG